MLSLLPALFCATLTPAFAEYRVFHLRIEKPAVDGQPSTIRYLDSNLDPEQYRAYGNAGADERITYVDTWRCRGRTDNFKAFCPSPRSPASDATQTQSPVTGLRPPESPE